MRFIQTAAYVPIFWLHHSYVDKVWAERQDNQLLQPMTHSELPDTILRPFGGKLIQSRGWCIKFATGLNTKIGINQKV